MSNFQVKAFILSKDGYTKSCQDSLAVNVVRNRFAVADGVTNSYHPELVSQILCKKFMEIECNTDVWDTYFGDIILKDVRENWKSSVNAAESKLSGRMLEHAKMKRNELPNGASTFAGIDVDVEAKKIKYFILGDSTFFAIDKQAGIDVFCTNAFISDTSKIDYNNHPDCVCADGHIIGKWKVGSIPLQEGYLLLMTDGCAEWFQDKYDNDKNVVDELWNLQNNEDFEKLATKCRKECKMDDDLALIIIKVEDSSNPHSDIVFCPDTLPMVIIENDNIETIEEKAPMIEIAETEPHQNPFVNNIISDLRTSKIQMSSIIEFHNLSLIK